MSLAPLRAAWLACALFVASTCPSDVRERTESFGRFGTVHVYQSGAQPARVALFLSDRAGWDAGSARLARAFASLDALVIGVDSAHYERERARSSEPCGYPAGELESLSKWVQSTLGRLAYEHPVLVGQGSGATLAYAALAQAPTGDFRGAISLGFCADRPVAAPLCAGSGLASRPDPAGAGSRLEPAAALASPWVALQGAEDRACGAAQTEAFAQRVKGGRARTLSGVGSDFAAAQASWLPEFREEFQRMADAAGPSDAPRDARVADLPLVELPVAAPHRAQLAVMLSGDGGWAGLDRDVGAALAAQGVPVVGFDTLQYFWSRRTPGEAARDLERILDHYLDAWGEGQVILVGYSLGADVLPFLASRLPERLRGRIALVALLGPSPRTTFEFHALDWIRDAEGPTSLPVGPELAKLGGVRVLCVYGDEERASLCPALPSGSASVLRMSGGHHFGGSYAEIAERILGAASAAAGALRAHEPSQDGADAGRSGGAEGRGVAWSQPTSLPSLCCSLIPDTRTPPSG